MAESNPGEEANENIARGNIEDMGAARETAYAEKPFRDAEADYRERLSDEAREALKYIASAEGEKALARYEATKNAEDPVVRVLREQAIKTLEFSPRLRVGIREALENTPDAKMGQVRLDEWERGAKWAIGELGRELVGEILAKPMRTQLNRLDRKAELENLGTGLGIGLEYSYEGTPYYPSDPEGMLWGSFIGELMKGEGISRIFEDLARSGKCASRDLIERHMGFFEAARVSFPSIALSLDRDLSDYQYVWDDKQKKYISL